MYRLNYKRGFTRVGVVAYVLCALGLLLTYADTPMADRLNPWLFLLFITVGTGVTVCFGVLCAMFAWLVVAWIVDGFSN